MKRVLIATVVVTAGVVAGAAGVPSKVTYVPHDKAEAMFKTGGRVIDENGLIVITQRRQAGEVEVHANTSHVFIIVDGEATFVTGGKLVNQRNTAPDQIRAASMEGGETHHLTKGDIITVPARTPHWFKEVPTGTIAYYAINSEP